MKKSLTVLQGHVPLRKAVLSGQEQNLLQPHCPDEKTCTLRSQLRSCATEWSTATR